MLEEISPGQDFQSSSTRLAAATTPAAPRSPLRLLTALDRLQRARVAVVSGPAGFGKRQLVREWLDGHREVAALWLDQPDELTELPSLLRDNHALAVAVVYRAEHLADQALVARLMELAERHSRLRVVFVGRSRPVAPLGSLAARGLLVDLDAEQLAWTREEVSALVEPGAALADPVLDTVMADTCGWPAMARILSQQHQRGTPGARAHRLADSYIADEVLSTLSPEDRALLRSLSPLTVLDPHAAAWMSGRGDAAAQLSRLQASGVPISWDEDNTIRLNPMLRGHLTRSLAREDPQLARELAERAAGWLRSRGRTVDAVALAAQAGLVRLAWRLAGEFITLTMYTPAMVRTVPSLTSMLPPGWETDMVRSVVRGLATPQTLVAQLAAVDGQQMRRQSDTGRLGYATFALGMARQAGYPADVDLAQALHLAEQTDPARVDEIDLALMAALFTEHGLWLLHHGQLEAAEARLLAALGHARAVNVPWAIVTTLGGLAWLHAERGSVATALRLADEAILSSAETVFTVDGIDELALLALAQLGIDTGDLAAARRWLEQVDRHEEHPAELDALATSVRAGLATALDDPAAARRMVQAYRDQPGPRQPQLHQLAIALAAFDAAVAMGDPEAAAQELQVVQDTGLCSQVTGLVVLQARLELARGDHHAARELLLPLVSGAGNSPLSHAKHTLHLLVVHGVVADELHHPDEALQAFQRAGVLADRLGMTGGAARHNRLAQASRRGVDLTDAERNVLAHLDPARTLPETADELFVSLNTLKTHLRRIYRKLGAANREEAIDRARVLGIRGRG